MTRLAALWSTVWVLGCSGVTEGAGGVVELQIRTPVVDSIEVGEALQLSALALDKDGNSVNTPITWRTPDTTLTVDQTGVVTGIAPGTGRVQAFAGSLASGLVSFNVIARADTLILVGDSIFTVAAGVASSPPLVVELQSFSPAGPLPSRPVVYAVTRPPDAGPHTVELPGGVLVDTLTTDADGRVSATLNRVTGVIQPDTAIVEVRALRTRGDAVPGSGQRFVIIFQ